LSSVVASGQASRQKEAEHAERLILEELEKLEREREREQTTPTIAGLFDWVGGVVQAEMARSLRGDLKQLSKDEQQALRRTADAITKKLLHRPATTLRRWAVERPLELQAALELVNELFLTERAGYVTTEERAEDEDVPQSSERSR
jgi:glutamyl-tRNA reductase